MIRLSYLSAEAGERSATFGSGVVRFGTDRRCELRLHAPRERAVAAHHGDIIPLRGAYVVVARDTRCLLWVNGAQIQRVRLHGGERIRVGSPSGPEIRILEVRHESTTPHPQPTAPEGDDPTIALTAQQMAEMQGTLAPSTPPPDASRFARIPTPTAVTPPPPPRDPDRPPVLTHLPWTQQLEPSPSVSVARFFRKPHAEVQKWLSLASEELRRARSTYDGNSSGHTMVILAKALTGLRQTAEGRTRNWRRGLMYLSLASLVIFAGLGGVIWYQQQRIALLVKEKAAIDTQIQSLFDAMANETDQTRLAQLEARLQVLMGNAAEKVLQVGRSNPQRAGELAAPPDELEGDIRRLLRSFNAETYAIPPIFKRTVKVMVDELASSPGLKANYLKKQRLWPQIQGPLHTRELPTELGYITFTESRFEPTALSPVGAAGMWQLMPGTARTCGLIVSPKKDERFDPARASDAAACYLSKLLVEFGQESFMLVLASYNRGENGVRAALHKVALEPGGYKRRDFWHLYRLKLLPDETRDYVPRVLAAALVFENPEKYGLGETKRQPPAR